MSKYTIILSKFIQNVFKMREYTKKILYIWIIGFLFSVNLEAKTKIRFYHPSTDPFFKNWSSSVEKEVESQIPNIDLVFLSIPPGNLIENIITMTNAGDWPDLIAVQEIGDFIAEDIIEPLDGYFINEPTLNISMFNKSVIDSYTSEGKLYAAPMSAIVYGLVINTDNLKEVGKSVDSLKTWNDLLDASTKMTNNGKYGYTFPGNKARFAFRDFYIIAASNGVFVDQLTDPKNKNRLIEIFNFLQKLHNTMSPATKSFSKSILDAHKDLLTGESAILGTGSYITGDALNLEMSFSNVRPIVFPKGPSGNQKALVGGFGYSIFKGSKNKDVSWKILKIIMQDKFNTYNWGHTHPSAKKKINSYDEKRMKEFWRENYIDQKDILSRWNSILNSKGLNHPVVKGQVDIEESYLKHYTKFINGIYTTEDMIKYWLEDIKKIQKGNQ